MRKALQAPARQIFTNAGEDGSVIVGKILENSKYSFGYNAQIARVRRSRRRGRYRPDQGRALCTTGCGLRCRSAGHDGGDDRRVAEEGKLATRSRRAAAAWAVWAAWTFFKSSTERHNVKSRKPRKFCGAFFMSLSLPAFFEREVIAWGHSTSQRYVDFGRYDALDDNYSNIQPLALNRIPKRKCHVRLGGTREITPDLQILEIKLNCLSGF